MSAFPIAPRQPPLTTGDLEISDSVTGGDWLQAGVIVAGSIVVAVAAARIIRGLLRRTLGDGFASIIISRLIAYVLFLVGLVYALNTLDIRVGPLLGALGLSGLVLALALQSVAENFVGGVLLQTRRPFTIGDTVLLGDHTGVVLDIDARTTVLRGLDGTHIRLPNANVLDTPIVNLTRERLRRSELDVGVAYDSDLARATHVLVDAVRRVPRVARDPEPWVMLREFGESSIVFTIYYWHGSDVPSELAGTHDLILAVHRGLAEAGITIAFPQLVVWPGHDAAADPYDDRPTTVYTERAAVPDRHDQSDEGASESSWRWPWRQ